MPRTADPHAQYLDACQDAHQAGVCQEDVTALLDAGDEIALLALLLAPKLMRMTDGRMASQWVGKGVRREPTTITVEEIADAFVETAFGHLDSVAVIKAGVALRIANGALDHAQAA